MLPRLKDSASASSDTSGVLNFAKNRRRSHDLDKTVLSLVKDFILSNDDCVKIMQVVTEECDRGLKRSEATPVKERGLPMICSHVTKLPTGQESGSYLALDFGGTNFRIVGVNLSGSAADLQMQEISHRLPASIRSCSCDELFDYIAKCTDDALVSWGFNRMQPIPVGFTFSFPCRHESLRDAVSIAMTKEFKVKDLLGANVADCLENSLHRRGLKFSCVATVNDTVSTLSACHFEDHRCRIGVVVGTGTNAAYVEKLRNIHSEGISEGDVIVNTEWAHTGDTGLLNEFRNEFDRKLDAATANPGCATMEKMTSGLYLGELARLAMLHFAKIGQLFSGKVPNCLQEENSFPTRFLSEVSQDPPDLFYSTERLLLFELQLSSVSQSDLKIVRALCEAIIDRSARIIGAGIASLLLRIGTSGITIGVDGSLFKFHPHFSNLLAKYIHQILPDRNFQLQLSEDGSGKGVALISAAALH